MYPIVRALGIDTGEKGPAADLRRDELSQGYGGARHRCSEIRTSFRRGRFPLTNRSDLGHHGHVVDSMTLDPDRCYRAAQSRDSRFDGCFITAVKTTGIYCRPSCPAMTPKRQNVEFYRSAAAAQQRGFGHASAAGLPRRPVRPNGTCAAISSASVRLIADGVVDREGVTGLSRRLATAVPLGGSTTSWHRAAGARMPAQTARTLIETTNSA